MSVPVAKNQWWELTPYERRNLVAYCQDQLRMDRRKREKSAKKQDRDVGKYADPVVCWAAEWGIELIRRRERIDGHIEEVSDFLIGSGERSFVLAVYRRRSRRLCILACESSAASEESALHRLIEGVKESLNENGSGRY